jgi:hemin uptake protein HemP
MSIHPPPPPRAGLPRAVQTADSGDSSPRIIAVAELLGGGREVIIQHGAQSYRLRLTANDKLILTK